MPTNTRYRSARALALATCCIVVGGCAYMGAPGSGASVGSGYRYALEEAGTGTVLDYGLTDADAHYYPYATDLPSIAVLDPVTGQPYTNGLIVSHGTTFGLPGYDTLGLTGSSGIYYRPPYAPPPATTAPSHRPERPAPQAEPAPRPARRSAPPPAMRPGNPLPSARHAESRPTTGRRPPTEGRHHPE